MSIPRDQLKFRAPPSMQLSDGSATSKTAPPQPSSNLTPAERATARFAVTGSAIITGGAGDIGSVACKALLEHGLLGLAIFDLHPDAGQTSVNQLQSKFPHAKITFTKVDVTDAEAVSQAVAQAERDVGPINLCFCFAGIAFAIHALDITPEQWRKMLEVNTTGAFLVAQAVAKSMVSRGNGGSIVLMASISAHIVNFPQPQVHYNAAKAAILSIKKSLAAEWARYGIRVNSISPGYMDTILNEGEGLEEHRQTWKQRNPYGRMGKPEELTGAVILLASKAGSYITGADILVDGGISVF
ncbi:short chain dehydrogenase reductase family [Colletotrichum kahawae]|uniref:D-arabinitol 2-dehydrogenase [ribulose-forming] n=1 Tax=Colletotrichum kahawae TaxID=34407 RepID=A0AAD9Y8D8_COLKA|nr:short chain dehydrogenase reductase family [Colletotrichum kahawae]